MGTHLAKMLSNENQDIIVIDNDATKLANLEKYNLMTYVGSAISFEVMRDVSVGSADLFIAVTPFESRNLVACSMAKSLARKKRWRESTTTSS